ncbi:hypothetical protein C5C04_12015 [Rathayibacter rathayi]|uniref:Uncharacterized protein n=1 Tax=Rathayibacter rathayi TaxID=33887 RepID=A0ABD6W6H2_RATRA|nr:hypothetical protein C5C04_12015 [Rathayibacter rathayi]
MELRDVGAVYAHGLILGRHVVAVASRSIAQGQDGPGMVGLASLHSDARRPEIEIALDVRSLTGVADVHVGYSRPVRAAPRQARRRAREDGVRPVRGLS